MLDASPRSPLQLLPEPGDAAGWRARCIEAERRSAEAERRVEALEEKNREQVAVIAKLSCEVAELKRRLDQNSSNSSKPPSSDPESARARRKKRTESRRKRGAQKGHEGVTRSMVPTEQVTKRIDVHPTECVGCGGDLAGGREVGTPTLHQVVELPPIQPEVNEYVLHGTCCPQCGLVNHARPPAEARYRTGPRLTAATAMLVGEYHLSREAVADLLDTLFGVPICKGTVQACCERTGAALEQPVRELTEALPQTPSAFMDETGWREAGAKRWLWIAVTTAFVVFAINAKRGRDQLRQWFPNGYKGVIHSDRWTAYHFFDRTLRQLCWSHLIRDLTAIMEAKLAGSEAAAVILKGVDGMFRQWHAFRNGEIGRDELKTATTEFRNKFREFCATGEGQAADRKWRAVGHYLLKFWPAVFLFIERDGVEPTNNTAERWLRPAVLWRKICQGTRSADGSVFAGRILTTVGTCRLQGRGVLDYLTDAVRCHITGTPVPSLLPRGTPEGQEAHAGLQQPAELAVA
jgi:transposase